MFINEGLNNLFLSFVCTINIEYFFVLIIFQFYAGKWKFYQELYTKYDGGVINATTMFSQMLLYMYIIYLPMQFS